MESGLFFVLITLAVFFLFFVPPPTCLSASLLVAFSHLPVVVVRYYGQPHAALPFRVAEGFRCRRYVRCVRCKFRGERSLLCHVSLLYCSLVGGSPFVMFCYSHPASLAHVFSHSDWVSWWPACLPCGYRNILIHNHPLGN